MQLLTTEQTHDEINLFRLVRRLEKSVELPRSSSPSSSYSYSPSSSYSNSPYLYSHKDLDAGENEVEVWGKAQKELQKVKYARKLLKSVEGYEGNLHSSERQRRLNVLKMTLDTIETTLKSIERPSPPRPKSVLDQLPAPPEPSSSPEGETDARQLEADAEEAQGVTTPKQKPVPLPLPLSADDNFLLSPPDPQGPIGLPSSGLVSAIPGLMSAVPVPMPLDVPPRAGATTALESASAFGSLSHRKPTQEKGKAKGTEAHTHLQTQLSDQLAQMAVQLKRNALHFASSLEADKAVVEAAQSKIEGNMSFMETQRGRLKTLSGKTGGTTWLTLGIVLVTVLLFMVMVGVIRVLRI